MKVAVSSSGQDLEARLDPRFGRCRYFLIVDTDTLEVEAFENANADLSGGAGIQAAQSVADKGVKAVITGRCGPNAVDVLNAAGIGVYLGRDGTIQALIEQFNNGRLPASTQANAPSHAGTAGLGAGRGRGMGRGMGRGRALGRNR